MLSRLILFTLLTVTLNATVFIEREIAKDERNATKTDLPSKLGYFKYYEALPETIHLPIISNADMGKYKNVKYFFVGYGVDPLVDVNMSQCKKVRIAGKETRVCLPWWKIERVYECNNTKEHTNKLFDDLAKKSHPPKMVTICEEWGDDKIVHKRGRVTCTAYYDKNRDPECEKNPTMAKCLVNNCSLKIRKECTFKEYLLGAKVNSSYPKLKAMPPDKMALQDINDSDIVDEERYIRLGTLVYDCPDTIDETKKYCKKEKTVIMFPVICKQDDPKTPEYDAIWKYCPTDNYKIVNGEYQFYGKCLASETEDGKEKPITCTSNVCVDELTCTEPVYKDFNDTKTITCDHLKRKRKPCSEVYDVAHSDNDLYKVVYDGDGNPVIEKDGKCYISVQTGYTLDNPFEKDPGCLRVSDPREQVATASVYIETQGSLDDDIFIIKHTGIDTFEKIYCNQQHNEQGNNNMKFTYEYTYDSTGNKEVKYKEYDTGNNLVKEGRLVVKVIDTYDPQAVTSLDLTSGNMYVVEKGKSITFYLNTSKTITNITINPDAYNQQTYRTMDNSYQFQPHTVEKAYMDSSLICLDNNGHYVYPDQGESGVHSVSPGDVISVQRATEDEIKGCGYFNCGRTHFTASPVMIGNYEVAPRMHPAQGDYVYYPVYSGCYGGGCFPLWENTLGSLSLLFPYAGRYELKFMTNDGKVVADVVLDEKDFQKIAKSANGRMQLRLGATVVNKDANGYYNTNLLDTSLFNMDLSNINTPGFDSNKYENNATILAACLDNMAEVGCGVNGKKSLKDFISTRALTTSKVFNVQQRCGQGNCIDVPEPRLDYVKKHAIDHIIITNYKAQKVVKVQLVYPLTLMNQIYISKLDLYENLSYECYKDEYEECNKDVR